MDEFPNQTRRRRTTETIGFFVVLHAPLWYVRFRNLTTSTNCKRFDFLSKSVLENPRQNTSVAPICYPQNTQLSCYFFFTRTLTVFLRIHFVLSCRHAVDALQYGYENNSKKRKEKGQKSVSTVPRYVCLLQHAEGAFVYVRIVLEYVLYRTI